jgi:hypothetical protein
MDWNCQHVLLYAGPEKKANEFMKMWVMYRPLVQISVVQINTMDGDTVLFQGQASSYVNSRG